jgi:catechol 2,3-dioxygenase
MFTRRLDLDDLLKEAGESPRPEFQEPGEVHDP